MNIEEIKEIIPHRYPFLLIDEITEVDPGRSAAGVKNVSINEWYFAGHFPGRPIMPGVLQIEALAQVGAVAILSVPDNREKLVLFAGIDKVRFKRQVSPGDRLILKVEISRWHGKIGKGLAQAHVNEQLVVQAELMFAIAD